MLVKEAPGVDQFTDTVFCKTPLANKNFIPMLKSKHFIEIIYVIFNKAAADGLISTHTKPSAAVLQNSNIG